jgi:hypothetical protein
MRLLLSYFLNDGWQGRHMAATDSGSNIAGNGVKYGFWESLVHSLA